ncbi:phosphoribosylglycinamide formyltransferase, partial [Neisseria gonorrhoeae]
WKIQNRKKHNILVAPNNRRIAIPSTPSDCKAIHSFTKQIKYLFQE